MSRSKAKPEPVAAGTDDHFGDMLAEALGFTLPSRDVPESPPADEPATTGKPVRNAVRPRKRPLEP